MNYWNAPSSRVEKNLQNDFSELVSRIGISVHVTEEQLKGKVRTQHIVCVRQIAIYILRGMRYGTKQVGAMFNRDHSTVTHSCNVLENMITTNDSYYMGLFKSVVDCEDVFENNSYIGSSTQMTTDMSYSIYNRKYVDLWGYHDFLVQSNSGKFIWLRDSMFV